jgi:hypothetical protein
MTLLSEGGGGSGDVSFYVPEGYLTCRYIIYDFYVYSVSLQTQNQPIFPSTSHLFS